MQIISLILSGLALLAAIASFIFTVKEKKRGQNRNAAMADHVRAEIEKAVSVLRSYTDDRTAPIASKVAELESGITPNYEQAKAAADAVNDFSRGISNILGFDPIASARKQREREHAGGETE